MRAVVVGSGSAGRRHARMLRRIRPDLEITVVRRVSSTGSTDGLDGLDELHELGVQVVATLDEATRDRPHISVVASPSTFHRPSAVRLLGVGSTVLIEKPIAAQMDAARAIQRAELDAGRPVLIGYHLRFGDVLPELRRMVTSGVLGRPTGFRLEVGQHLSEWRPDTDPRNSVSARHDLGGGVLLELSHELDALRFALDTEVSEVHAASLRDDGAPTDGQVDTVADLELRTDAGVSGTVHLDMVAAQPFRRWVITGSDATATADVLGSTIRIERADGRSSPLVTFEPQERDRAEERLIRHLLDLAEHRGAPHCSSADGIAALAIVDAARTSARSGTPASVRRLEQVPS